MKVKVTHRFTDTHTGELYFRGAVLDITEERYREIRSVGNFVFPLKQDDVLLDCIADEAAQNGAESPESTDTVNSPTEQQKPVETAKDAPGDGFDIMSVRELKEYADAAHKLTFKGGTKKADIIKTLRQLEQKNK